VFTACSLTLAVLLAEPLPGQPVTHAMMGLAGTPLAIVVCVCVTLCNSTIMCQQCWSAAMLVSSGVISYWSCCYMDEEGGYKEGGDMASRMGGGM